MEPMGIDAFKRFKSIFKLCTNGRGLPAFLVQRFSGEGTVRDAWCCEGPTGPCRLVRKNVQDIWWWDDDHLLVREKTPPKGTAAGRTHLVVIPLQPGSAPGAHTELPLDAEELLVLPGGRLLVAAVWQPPAACAQPGDAASLSMGHCHVAEQLPIWRNGEGFVEGRRTRLYLWDGATATALTDEWTDVSQLRLSGDGHFAYYIANRYTAAEGLCDKLYCLSLANLAHTELSVEEHFSHTAYAPLPGGEVLVYGHSTAGGQVNQNGSFYRVKEGAQPLLLNGTTRYNAGNSILTDLATAAPHRWFYNAGRVYWVATLEESAHLLCIDATTGHIEQLTTEDGAVFEAAPGGENTLYFTAMRGQGGMELYRAGAPFAETALTHCNGEVAFAYSTPTPLRLPGGAGHELHGRVLPPTNFEVGKRYPAILCIHGGPKMAYGDVLHHEMQYLAAQGFGVLWCNPTGSEGRGAAFADIRGRWGQTDCDDVLRFVNAALAAHPWMDASRLGVCGGSYGGFLVNWLIGHTGRFAAAVSQRGISNWTTMALTSDIGYFFAPDEAGADVWADHETLWQRSPLAYAGKVRTSTLFLHSERDCRCRPEESVQMYTALRLHGVPAKLCLFEGENHDLSRSGKPANRVRRLAEMAAWFTRYLAP